jgi:peptidoglycan pentaglycine glycine transferase (the first glycine)
MPSMDLIETAQAWNESVSWLPHAHFLQSWEWGEFKSRYGWTAKRYLWRDESGVAVAAAQILERSGPAVSILYAPRGPLLDWHDTPLVEQVITDLKSITASRGAIFIKLDPEIAPIPLQSFEESPPAGPDASILLGQGGRLSQEQVQFRNTLVLDLAPSEEELLAAMKQKTRYNIRLAQRKGVTIRKGNFDDLELLYQMYAETSLRDGFVIRSQEYYLTAWGSFINAGFAQPLIAEVEGEPIGAVIIYRFGKTAWYFYGMSGALHRNKMANYLLQWEAIRWAKAMGCDDYDFWGAPDQFNEEDPMWGVYRFKLGFSAETQTSAGAFDFTSRPLLYWLFTTILPRVMGVMRRVGRRQTQTSLNPDLQ